MKKTFQEVVDESTAQGQLFETKELLHSNGNTYKEFINTPKTLKDYYQFGLLHPEVDWLVFENERYTYKDVLDRSHQVANALNQQGLKKGDRVAVCMQNNPEYIFIYLACTSMGFVFVPLNSWWVAKEIIYGLDNSGAKIIFGDEKRLKGLESHDAIKIIVRAQQESSYQSFNNFVLNQSEVLPDVTIDTDDNATIFYTSGSTGYPKGVLSSHRNILATLFSWALFFSARSASAESNSEEDDTTKPPLSLLHCVPLFHVTGSHAGLLMSVLSGRKIVLMPKWDPTEALKLIEAERITAITGVPTQTWDLLNHPQRDEYDLSSLDDLSGGGAPRPPEHVKRLNDEMNGSPSIGYGLTETNAVGTLNAGEDYIKHAASCGKAVPPVTEIAIADDDWNHLEEGQTGEVLIKSPANMSGYWNNPDATNEVFGKDGWFRTGDIGYIKDEFLYIIDRAKDLVIRGGENISCIEVESAISLLSAVREVAVFGISDERLGEVLCAAIYTDDKKFDDASSIQSFLKDKLADFQIPQHIKIYLEPLPRIASGKFSKPEMRDEFKKLFK